MGHTRRQGTPGLMLSRLLVLAGLLYLASGRQVTKAVREAVTLSCEYNISVTELDRARVYWQKDKEMVLSIVAGRIDVWSEYKNRTILDIANKLSLVILTLRLSDRGTYSCVVQKPEKGMFKLHHLSSVTLAIKADFPTPSITDLGNISTDIKMILCSTSGGFPKPLLSWLENGEEINTAHPTVSQDPQTELFAVSSELHFNMTSNHIFKCLVKYGDKTVSETFIWQKPQPSNPDTPDHEFPAWMSFVIFIFVISVLGVGALVYKKCAPQWRERRRRQTADEDCL
ncbi:PREDICTED: T-lymphocyte activation antigen CD80 [Chinchilla lanigera]|uniref:T-lymphocyte activation antigen CD80 n=1 Tax=Chinchilla lanigera TaxID=34839 RepID=A0A8C2VKE7_CHILA|nr:PREDICTED: T-lymphocyte activation antigen CD80 [Chinchilla lanigera]XP_013370670.1 PREDICTED: T-lymphocyte activation antigen CD80 [Chinchilla lanigera]